MPVKASLDPMIPESDYEEIIMLMLSQRDFSSGLSKAQRLRSKFAILWVTYGGVTLRPDRLFCRINDA
jgi:hypothetical protein